VPYFNYQFANLVAKRAKEIETLRRVEVEESDKKAISMACEEVYEGKVKPSNL